MAPNSFLRLWEPLPTEIRGTAGIVPIFGRRSVTIEDLNGKGQ